MMADQLTSEIMARLAEPFEVWDLGALPKGNPTADGLCMALTYIDSRAVMDRLDTVVGPENWSFEPVISEIGGKHVCIGRLTVCGVTKADVGEAGAEGEPFKSAVSDAVKRSAVHFGIGRYLYSMPRIFWGFDKERRRFCDGPQLLTNMHAISLLVHAAREAGEDPSSVSTWPFSWKAFQEGKCPVALDRGQGHGNGHARPQAPANSQAGGQAPANGQATAQQPYQKLRAELKLSQADWKRVLTDVIGELKADSDLSTREKNLLTKALMELKKSSSGAY